MVRHVRAGEFAFLYSVIAVALTGCGTGALKPAVSTGAGSVSNPTAQLLSISPSYGLADQATNATLSGIHFQAGSRVRVSGSYATNVQVSGTASISVSLPALGAGVYTVEVVNPDNSTASLPNAFTYVQALTVTSSTLPGAMVGEAYQAPLSALGGSPPYTWSVATGSLPAGISLDSQGQVSGTPAQAGKSDFTTQVQDSLGYKATRQFSISTQAPPAPPSAPPQPPPAPPPPSPAPPPPPPPTPPPPSPAPPPPPPTPPPPTPPPPGGTPSGTALSSCQSINVSGDYYLEKDVTCTSQGFALNADNISINLNGHTITYGSPDAVVPAFSVCDQWYTQLPTSACGSAAHGNLEIYNGKIVQSTSSKDFTPAIWIGQANGMSGGSIHDLTITIQQTGAQAIHGDFPGWGWKIQNNTINDNVTNIQQPGQSPLGARSQFQGQTIHMDDGTNHGPGDVISGNTINGSPQGGIYDTNANTQIYDNVITLSSSYSNDYGVTVLADGENVHDNTIQGRGRGLDGESSNFVFNHNTIDVHEVANNSEYGGCELGGSDGIRVKNYAGQVPSTGWTIENNTIKVEGSTCAAHGLRFTDLSHAVSGMIRNNSFTVTGNGNFEMNTGREGDYALSFSGIDGPSLTYAGNTFSGDVCAQIDSDGAHTSVQPGQTWSCGEYAADDIDLPGGFSGNYSQALTLGDSPSNKAIYCGPYSRGLIKVESTTKQCP